MKAAPFWGLFFLALLLIFSGFTGSFGRLVAVLLAPSLLREKPS